MNRRKGILFASLGLLAVLLSFVGSPFFSPFKKASAASITGLHVSGNHLLNGDNLVVQLLGVNRSGAEYMCVGGYGIFDGPSDAASVDAMASWHINSVRIPLNEDCWLGINGVPAADAGSNYQQAIINYVNLLNSKHLIAVLDLHWAAPGTTLANSQLPMPNKDHSIDFWKSVASTFKDNSSVVFEPFNEPHDDNGSCWLNGSTAANTAPCPNTAFAAAGMQELVTAIRSTGASNIIMLNGWGWGNWIAEIPNYLPNDPLHNLMVDVHIYNFSGCASVSCYNTSYLPVVQQLPVVIGELGENDCAHGFIDTTMNWADQNGIGYLGWAWDTYNCSTFPALISSYDGTPTNFGIGLRDHLAALANGGTPTVTPTPTSTPTPTPTSTPTPTPTPGTSCSVHYNIANQWPGGFTTYMTVTNTGTSTINGWTLQFTFPNGQQITQIWNGTYTQQGSQVTIHDAGYNASLTPGSQATPGFNGSWSSSNSVPTDFKLNNATCSIV